MKTNELILKFEDKEEVFNFADKINKIDNEKLVKILGRENVKNSNSTLIIKSMNLPIFDVIQFKIKEDSKINKVNGLMVTTITKLTDNIVSGPTPMLNPPLLIPLDEFDVKPNELVDVKLTYQMGGGIESINLLHI